ncbi:hypothetical protein F9278_31480 [Streptomyces phaeolivaceus]|uniref:DUF7737 domain-containing protein n=1 Tax=Streptomyces phaeolivaceus TaxID=2653200 RepID=A0A5P8KBL0_9ACTN|nr:hypothetical protein F9278_31480 [Streptomyces phaeolivaceus]
MRGRGRAATIRSVSKSAVGGGNRTARIGHLLCEGDRMLAVILVILSKAMLLAKDTEIADPTILSQL